MASLVVREAGRPEKRCDLDRQSLVIGRERRAGLCLANVSVSRRHAKIVNGEHGFVIEDLQSRNGVLVNGQAQQRARLRTGDLIQIGKYLMTFYGDERTQLDHRFNGKPLADIPPIIGVGTGDGDTGTFTLSPAMVAKLRDSSLLVEGARVLREEDGSQVWVPGSKGLILGKGGHIETSGFPWFGKVAAVAWTGNAHVLRRLGKLGVVSVNGQAVTEKRLNAGDRFQVGGSSFKYEVVEG